jgi:CheY-like chemotaxis protein
VFASAHKVIPSENAVRLNGIEFRRSLNSGYPQTGCPVVLCIENNPASLAVRKAVLESAGYTVLIALSGDMALQLLRSTHVDLVLSDHYLKGELGSVLAGKIKAVAPKVPIILLSGASDELKQVKEVDAVMPKASNPTEMLVCIAKALGL